MLLADFCTRLACGLSCVLLGMWPLAVSVSYVRTVMLAVLGLAVLAALAGFERLGGPEPFWLASAFLAFVGSITAALNRSLANRWIAALLALSTALALMLVPRSVPEISPFAGILALGSAGSSGLLLGSMMAAMLLGHSYLISPTQSIDPLRRLAIFTSLSLLARAALANAGLVVFIFGLRNGSAATAVDTFNWLLIAARWVVGVVGPAIIVSMVWQTVKIRSTQSATGIMYAGVGFVFFGEVTSMVLSERFGVAL